MTARQGQAVAWLWPSGYVATIFAANWAITTVGIVPVGFGLTAPAGVFLAGAAFTLRDLSQEAVGRGVVVVAAVGVGAGLSALLSGPLAVASGSAFLVSELADFAVYTPLRRRNLPAAVAMSNTLGAGIDSALFGWLAFGSLDQLAGQLLGKTWTTVAAVAALAASRRRWRR